MLRKIDHIGIAVHDLDAGLKFFQEVFGLKPIKIETLEDISVIIAFLPLGEVLIELLQPTSPGAGSIGRFLVDKGPGFHHIAYRVEDIDQALVALKANGVAVRDDPPRPGGDDSRISFLNPGDTQNVLTELVERSHEIGAK